MENGLIPTNQTIKREITKLVKRQCTNEMMPSVGSIGSVCSYQKFGGRGLTAFELYKICLQIVT